MSRSYPHPQQPAPLQGLPLHLVNGIDCEKYLRNSGVSWDYLVFSCVTMQLKVIIRDSYRGPGISPKAQISPLIFLRIIINFIQCQIQGLKIAFVESKFVSKNLTSKIIILRACPRRSTTLYYAGKGSGDMAIPKLFWWNAEVVSIIS